MNHYSPICRRYALFNFLYDIFILPLLATPYRVVTRNWDELNGRPALYVSRIGAGASNLCHRCMGE
jgi:1-acyl-sn-glycerol-3-phosphate acyltransferase